MREHASYHRRCSVTEIDDKPVPHDFLDDPRGWKIFADLVQDDDLHVIALGGLQKGVAHRPQIAMP
jgi:hypothetical protein